MRNVKKIVKRYFRQVTCLVLTALMLSYSPMAIALDDTDAHVVNPGSAGVTKSGDITTVTMNESSAIINWDTLNTEDYETLQFIKESGNFDVLNRVGGGETIFNGDLIANQGHIIIVNPAGIVFGPDALINAAQFTASALNMTDQQFENYLNGSSMTFEGGYGSVTFEGTSQDDHTGGLYADKVALIGKKVLNSGSIVSNEGFVLMATGDKVVIGSEGSDVMVELIIPVTRNIESPEDLGDVINQGSIENSEGNIILAAGDTFAQALNRANPLSLPNDPVQQDTPTGNVIQEGTITHGSGTLSMSAVNEVTLENGSSTVTGGNVEMSGDAIVIKENLDAGGSMKILAENTVKVLNGSELSSGDNMSVVSINNTISLSGRVSSGKDMTLESGKYISAEKDLTADGNMAIKTEGSNGNDTYALGNLEAGGNITLDTNLNLAGGQWVYDEDRGLIVWEGQSVIAKTGILKAFGWIHKITAGDLYLHGGYDSFSGEAAVQLLFSDTGILGVANGGNIYISANGNIDIRGNISAMEPVMLPGFTSYKEEIRYPHEIGGVSIISDNGEIYSDSVGVGLDINILGYSDEVTIYDGIDPIGVDLPYGPGKAAIVIKSKKDLTIGSGATLIAQGNYLAEGQEPEFWEGQIQGVDNRPGVDFLDEDAVIGGYPRQQGEPIDVAIYAGSTEGDVTVGSPDIYVWNSMYPYYAAMDSVDGDYDFDDYYYYYEELGTGTVVYDAYNKVKFDFVRDFYNIKSDAGNLDKDFYRFYDYRVEVCSRITEWLGQAIEGEKLPYADEPEYMEELFHGGYVLRGAGVSPYTRAWVLEDQPPAVSDAAPLAVMEEPVIEGCPVQLDTVAAELGINSDELQMAIGSSLALNPNVQPCDACGRLIKASTILKDTDGTRFAALNQIFNTLAPANVPFTAQTSADIVTSFAQLSAEDTRYALASEYIDAFVEYVAVLDQDLGAPVGNSVAYAMEKHGKTISTSPNGNIGAYLLSRLESFGE